MIVIPFWLFMYLLIGVIVAYKNNFKGFYFWFYVILWFPMLFIALSIIGLMIWEERKRGKKIWKR